MYFKDNTVRLGEITGIIKDYENHYQFNKQDTNFAHSKKWNRMIMAKPWGQKPASSPYNLFIWFFFL